VSPSDDRPLPWARPWSCPSASKPFAQTSRGEIEGYFDGDLVDILVLDAGNDVGTTGAGAIENGPANPIYFVTGQAGPVLGTAIPGDPGYNPYWVVHLVAAPEGYGPVTSEDEIIDPDTGKPRPGFTLTPTDTIVLCVVLL
jgi:hypothetical protein